LFVYIVTNPDSSLYLFYILLRGNRKRREDSSRVKFTRDDDRQPIHPSPTWSLKRTPCSLLRWREWM